MDIVRMNIGHKTLSTPHTQNTVASPELHQALVTDLHKLRVNLEKKKKTCNHTDHYTPKVLTHNRFSKRVL